MSQPTLRTVRQNRPFKGPLELMLPNGGGAYALPSAFATYELRLYRHNNVTPFATGTVANGKIGIAVTAAATTITLNFPATDMGGLLGYGSMELISTDAGSEPVVVVPLQFVKEDTPYTVDAGQRLAIFAEHVVCVVRATTVVFALADTSFTLAQLNSAVSDGDLASAADLADHEGALNPHPQYASGDDLTAGLASKAPLLSPALAGTPTTPTAAPGTSSTQVASTAFVAAALASGGGGNALAGASALDVLPQALRGRKALALDLAGSGYAAFNDGAAAAMGTMADYASVTLSNSTGGSRITRKRLLDSVAANALRLTHDALARPMGALAEPAHAYTHTYSQPAVAELNASSSNVADAAAPDGWSGSWVAFGDNSVTRQGIWNGANSYVIGDTVYSQFLIRMDDGAAPVPGSSSATGDFVVLFRGSTGTTRKPSDNTPGADVYGPFAGGVYLVQAFFTFDVATSTHAVRIGKYAGQSARSFKVGPVSGGPGRYPPSLMPATGTAPSRAADVLSLPVTGFTADEITVAGEFTAPQPEAATRTVFCLKNGSDKLEMNFASGSSVPVIKLTVGGTEQFGGSAAALTPGQSYKFHVAASKADKLLRWKFTGLAAGSVGPTSPLTVTTSFTPAALDVGNAGGAAQLSSAIRSLAIVDRAWTAGEGEGYTDPGGVAVLSNAKAVLTADVQLATSNTFYDGPSLTLDAGTWLIKGKAQYLKTTLTASHVTARLHDGTNTLDDVTQYHPSVANVALGFGLFCIISLAAPATIKVQMATNVGVATALMKATAPNNGSGNNATRISAVRIG